MTASNHYQIADDVAKQANEDAFEAQKAYNEHLSIKEILQGWKRIMGHAYPEIFAIIFFLVAVAEYFVSYTIYNDIFPAAPWVIPVAIIFCSVLTSHLLAKSFSFTHMFDLELHEMSFMPEYKNIHKDQQRAMLRKKAFQSLILGILLFVFLTTIMTYFSIERVTREINAGIRTSGFNIQDFLPVGLYIFEILLGIYIPFLFRRFFMTLRCRALLRKFIKLVTKCAHNTTEAVKHFEEAEELGYSATKDPVSEDIHKAYYRNHRRDVTQKDEYVADIPGMHNEVKFSFMDSKGSPLIANVRIASEYNFGGMSATDVNGAVSFTVDSYEGDKVRDVVLEYTSADGVKHNEIKHGPFAMNNAVAHSVIV